MSLRVELYFARDDTAPEAVHTTVIDERFYGTNLRRLIVAHFNIGLGKWEPVTIVPFHVHDGQRLHTICRRIGDDIDTVTW